MVSRIIGGVKDYILVRRTLIRHGVEILRRSFFHFQGVRAFKSCKNYPVRVRDMVSVRVRASVRVRVVLRRVLLRGELRGALGKMVKISAFISAEIYPVRYL